MARYYKSRYLALEASTVYEVHEDGSYRSVSPEGHERRGTGHIPADAELDPKEALSAIARRSEWLRAQGKEGPPIDRGPAPSPEMIVHPLSRPGEGSEQARSGWKQGIE